MDSTSPSLPLGVVPSMMEMCTALGRVLGTLVERGPWVMDGQLLLGTMPALRDTHRRRNQWKPSPNTLSTTGTFDKKKKREPVYLRRVSLDFGTLLHYLFCNLSTEKTGGQKCKRYILDTPIEFVQAALVSSIPVSEATTLEEEVTAGHSSDLTGLLQPAM